MRRGRRSVIDAALVIAVLLIIAPVRAEVKDQRASPEESGISACSRLIKSVTCTCSEISIDRVQKASFPSVNGNCCGRPTWLVYRLPPLRLKRARERSASMMRDAASALSALRSDLASSTIGGRSQLERGCEIQVRGEQASARLFRDTSQEDALNGPVRASSRRVFILGVLVRTRLIL